MFMPSGEVLNIGGGAVMEVVAVPGDLAVCVWLNS